MSTKPPGFFEGTEMSTAGWWEALWPDPASVLRAVGIKPEMEVIDLCSGGGWFTLQIAKIARHSVAIDIDPAVLGEPRGPKTELRLSPSQTIEAVVDGGLAHVGTIDVPPYHYGALFVRSPDRACHRS